MSRNIDLTKPLSDEDRAYLEVRGRFHEIEQVDVLVRGTGATGASEEAFGSGPAGSGGTSGSDEAPEFGSETWFDTATVPMFKEELKKRNLAVSGNRDELAERLEEALLEEDDE